MRTSDGLAYTIAFCLGAALSTGLAAQEPIPATLLYVCIQDDAAVAIVDMDALEVVEIVRLSELGYGPNAAPHAIAVSSDHWYVSLIGEHRVLQLDAGNRLVATAEMETPGMVALDPTGARILVTRSMSATNPPRLLGFGGARPLDLDELDVLFPRPHAVAIAPSGRVAYTASLAVNQLAIIDLDSDDVELVDVPGPAQAFVQLAVSPDERTLVASGEISGQLLVFELDDSGRPTSSTSLDLGERPFDPVFSPDGREVWVPIKGANEVVVVETQGWTVRDRISSAGLSQPHAIEFSPDGRRAFVTNNGGAPVELDHGAAHSSGGAAQLVVIDSETREVEATLELGSNLTGLGRAPARRP